MFVRFSPKQGPQFVGSLQCVDFSLRFVGIKSHMLALEQYIGYISDMFGNQSQDFFECN